MSTEHTQTFEKEKVTFTEEQQLKVDELIRQRQGVAGREAREETARFKQELEATKAALAAVEAEKEELKRAPQDNAAVELVRLKAESVTQLAVFKANSDKADKAARESKHALDTMRKAVVIKDAASALNFFNLGLVTRGVEDRIKFDEDRNRFVVLNDNGSERVNSAYEPLSVDEFMAEYALQNPYLVRGDVKKGAGSTGNTEIAANGKYKVEDIFGKKSVAKLANQLAQSNMPEYTRLKAIAKANGLI